MAFEQQEATGNHSPRINQLLNSQTVCAGQKVHDWQEAVRMVGQILVESGSIEPGYVAAMERVIRELGPYAVIAPGIVLLHARPEDGVLEPCLALATLSTPVNFGHTQNDPVDIVLALGAVNKKAHIQALQQLSRLLAEPGFIRDIRSAKDNLSLLVVIDTWANKIEPNGTE